MYYLTALGGLEGLQGRQNAKLQSYRGRRHDSEGSVSRISFVVSRMKFSRSVLFVNRGVRRISQRGVRKFISMALHLIKYALGERQSLTRTCA